jgi:hypothetical protein
MDTSTAELANYRKSSPLRPADWRWRRALAMVEAKRVPDRFSDDKFVQASYKFASMIDSVDDSWEYYNKHILNEAISDAHAIYSQSDAKLTKWELESRILAREDIGTIAKHMCLTAKCIKWYESLFFNVLDRIDNVSWIVHHAVGKVVFYGAGERDFDAIWKFCGYFHGPDKLNWLLQHTNSQEALEWADKEIDVNMLRKTLHSSRIVAVNSWNQVQLLQLHQKNKELDLNTTAASSESSNPNLLGSFMNAISSVISTGSQIKENKELSWMSNDVNAAEPRASEAALIANGDEEVLVNLVGIKLPEAKADGNI